MQDGQKQRQAITGMNVHRPLLRVALAVWMVVVAASLACLFTLLLIRLGLLNPPSVSVIHGPVAITAEGERVYANGRLRTFYSIWIVVRPRTYRQIVKVEVPNRGAPIARRACRLVVQPPIIAQCSPPRRTP